MAQEYGNCFEAYFVILEDINKKYLTDYLVSVFSGKTRDLKQKRII